MQKPPRDWHLRERGQLAKGVDVDDSSSSIPLGYCQCGCGCATSIARTTNNARGYKAGDFKRFLPGHATRRKPSAGKTPEQYRSWWKQNTDVPYGYCWCGCGERTRLAHKHNICNGHVKGEPRRFIKSHIGRGRRVKVAHLVQDHGFDTPCWIWQNAKDYWGYGKAWGPSFGLEKRLYTAHRAYYEAKYGPVPSGLELDHLCQVPSCVNPDHLEPVSHTENIRRGRAAKISPSVADEIRRTKRETNLTYPEIAELFGVTVNIVSGAVKGRTWS